MTPPSLISFAPSPSQVAVSDLKRSRSTAQWMSVSRNPYTQGCLDVCDLHIFKLLSSLLPGRSQA